MLGFHLGGTSVVATTMLIMMGLGICLPRSLYLPVCPSICLSGSVYILMENMKKKI